MVQKALTARPRTPNATVDSVTIQHNLIKKKVLKSIKRATSAKPMSRMRNLASRIA